MRINIIATNIHNIDVKISCFFKDNKKDLVSFCDEAVLMFAKR